MAKLKNGLLAIGDVNGGVRVLDMEHDRQCRFEGRVMAGRVLDICWDATAQLVALVGEGRGIYVAIIDIVNGQSLGELAGPTKACTTATFLPPQGGDKRPRLIVGSDDFNVYLFDAMGKNYQLSSTVKIHARFITKVLADVDGVSWLSAAADGKIFLHQEDQSPLELTKESNTTCTVTGLDLNKEGILFSCSTDGILRRWNIRKGEWKCESQSNPLGQQILGIKLLGADISVLFLDGSFVILDQQFNIKQRMIVSVSLY